MNDDDDLDDDLTLMKKILEDLNKCFSCERKRTQVTKENCCDMCRPRPNYPRMAPEGTIFVCGACGKISKDMYGEESSSWDESCMLNSVLCKADSFAKTGNWVAVKWELEKGE